MSKTKTALEVGAALIGIAAFAFSIYAMQLSVRVNRLSLQKLKDEGYPKPKTT